MLSSNSGTHIENDTSLFISIYFLMQDSTLPPERWSWHSWCKCAFAHYWWQPRNCHLDGYYDTLLSKAFQQFPERWQREHLQVSLGPGVMWRLYVTRYSFFWNKEPCEERNYDQYLQQLCVNIPKFQAQNKGMTHRTAGLLAREGALVKIASEAWEWLQGGLWGADNGAFHSPGSLYIWVLIKSISFAKNVMFPDLDLIFY